MIKFGRPFSTRDRLSKVSVNNRHDAYIVASSTAKSLRDSLGLQAQATAYEFVCGAISALDPYSAFMSSNQFSETMSQIEGNFVGLGVELRTHEDHLEIVSVISGGSAGKGGLVKGDRIIGVDRQSVPEIGADRAADLMRGPEGSFVQITVDRGQGPQTVNLERRRVEIPSVDQVGIVDSQAGVGYIRLTNFQKTTARDFDAALWKLHREGMRSLIVDVRGNPGGLLSASVDVADRFINQGVIVSTRGRNPMEDFTHRANIANTWRLPLVVLVDENSASASEIFAAAIRDHRRGTIVGNQSYGKGSVQGIFPLNVSGGGVRLTTAKFYSPKGNAISEVGVKADVLVQESAKFDSETPTGDDNGLRIGIQTARRSQRVNSPIQTNAIGQSQPHRPAVAER
jgi:carboxyl-terminal processing protease